MIIGLTGQSGAGKSTVCEILVRQESFAVIDCDMVSRSVTVDGSLCNRELKTVFPKVIDDKLHLDRRALAGIVFGDKEKLGKLESIIYPYITARINDLISQYAANGYSFIVLDAPTLFEAGIDSFCDRILSVIADRNIRFGRIKQRESISDELINKRFDSQKDERFFIEHSDFIVNNDSDIEYTRQQTENIINRLREEANG